MEVGNNMPPDKNRSICADDVSVGTVYSVESRGVSGKQKCLLQVGKICQCFEVASVVQAVP